MLKQLLLILGLLALGNPTAYSSNGSSDTSPGQTLPGRCSTGLDPSWVLPGQVCDNGPAINLDALITGDIGGTWTGPGVSGNTLNPSGLSGNVTITYTHAAAGCFDSLPQAVFISTVSVAPDSITASHDSVCPGGSAALYVNGGSLGTGATWTWYTGGCGSVSVGTGDTLIVNPTISTTYYVRGEGTCGNSACMSFTVYLKTESTDPISIDAPSSSVCGSGSMTLSVVGGSLGTGAGWVWHENSCGGNPIDTAASIVVSPSSTTAYYVRAEGDCIISNCVSVSIGNTPNGDASWAAPDSVCETNGTVGLPGLVTGNLGGVWSGPGVSGTNFEPAGLGGQTVSIMYTQGTTPCIDTVIHDIVVTSVFSAAWTNPFDLCTTNGLVDFNDFVTGDLGGNWSGPAMTGSVMDPSGLSGNITVTYSIGFGACQSTSVNNIDIHEGPIAPLVTVTDSTICSGETTIISVSNPQAQTDYNLYDAATGGSLVGQTDYTASPGVTTTYYVQAEDNNGCFHSGALVPVTITVVQSPNGDAGNNVVICQGASVTLTATGGTDYLWSTTEPTASITVSPSVDTWYFVDVTNSVSSCTVTDSVLVDVILNNDLDVVNDFVSTQSGETISIPVLSNDTGEDPTTLAIVSGPAAGIGVVSGPLIDYSADYNFTGIDSVRYSVCHAVCPDICNEGVVFITVAVNTDLTIPTGFSPNGDGFNDDLVIVGLNNYPDARIEIYNRWGELVYSANPYNNDWGGETNGSRAIGTDVPDGTYFYVLHLNDTQEPFSGSIEIKRK